MVSGRSNVGRARQYSLLFQSLIADWRKQWKQELPFYFVQLANYLRSQESQPSSHFLFVFWVNIMRYTKINSRYNTRAFHRKCIRLCFTQCSPFRIGLYLLTTQVICQLHKIERQLLSLANTYQRGTYDVPAFQEYRISGNKLILSFDCEVKTATGEPKGFIIAGPDQVFYQATATIQGKEVILESPEVEIPIAARYGWADNPE